MSTELTYREWWDLRIEPDDTPDDVIKLLAKLPVDARVDHPSDRPHVYIRFVRETKQ